MLERTPIAIENNLFFDISMMDVAICARRAKDEEEGGIGSSPNNLIFRAICDQWKWDPSGNKKARARKRRGKEGDIPTSHNNNENRARYANFSTGLDLQIGFARLVNHAAKREHFPQRLQCSGFVICSHRTY